jgi:hypothetical protein
MWVVSDFSLYRCDDAGHSEPIGSFKPDNASGGAQVLLEDHAGAVWIGSSDNGLFQYHGSHFERVPTSHQRITNLTEDREGNMWVGTQGGGLNRVQPRAVSLESAATGLSEVGVEEEIAKATEAAFKSGIGAIGKLVKTLEESVGAMPKRPDKIEMEFGATLSADCKLWIVSGKGETHGQRFMSEAGVMRIFEEQSYREDLPEESGPYFIENEFLYQDVNKWTDLARDIEGVETNQVYRRLLSYNFADFDMALCPRLALRPEREENLLQMMQTFDLAIKDGVVWKQARWIREALGFPPADDTEEAGLAAEQQAQQEAEAQVRDAQTSNRVKAMSDQEAIQAIRLLAYAMKAQDEQKAVAA